MKRWRQVLHVARKDLRVGRGMLAVHAVVVAVATAAVLGWFGGILLHLLVLAIGTITMAGLVHADSPVRADAFWATRPLDPCAVVGAKLLVAAAALIGIGLFGHAVALAAHDVPARAYPALLTGPALRYAWWLALAALVAALTRDVRSFLLVLVLLIVLMQIGGGALLLLLERAGSDSTATGSTTVQVIILAAMLGVVARQYAVRDVRGGIRWALVILVVAWAVAFVVPATTNAGSPPNLPRLESTAVTLVPTPGPPDAGRFLLRVERDPRRPDVFYTIRIDRAEVRTADGSSVALPVREDRYVLAGPDAQVLAGVAGADTIGLGQSPLLSLDLSSAARTALRQPGSRIAVVAQVVAWKPRIAAVLPLEAGRTTTSNGVRYRIDEVDLDPHRARLSLRSSHVHWDDVPVRGPQPGPEFVLARRDRTAAIAFSMQTGSGSGGALVLPSRSSTRRVELGMTEMYGPDGPILPDLPWLADAELLAIEWSPAGSMEIRAEFEVRLPVMLRSR